MDESRRLGVVTKQRPDAADAGVKGGVTSRTATRPEPIKQLAPADRSLPVHDQEGQNVDGLRRSIKRHTIAAYPQSGRVEIKVSEADHVWLPKRPKNSVGRMMSVEVRECHAA